MEQVLDRLSAAVAADRAELKRVAELIEAGDWVDSKGQAINMDDQETDDKVKAAYILMGAFATTESVPSVMLEKMENVPRLDLAMSVLVDITAVAAAASNLLESIKRRDEWLARSDWGTKQEQNPNSPEQ
jgi:hypothetical protein